MSLKNTAPSDVLAGPFVAEAFSLLFMWLLLTQ